MKVEYKLVGLSKGKKATLELLNTDKETFHATIDMPEDHFNSMFNYCQGHWDDKKIAIVECDSVLENGAPVNGVMINFYEPV